MALKESGKRPFRSSTERPIPNMTGHLVRKKNKREMESDCVEKIIEVNLLLFFKGVKIQGSF